MKKGKESIPLPAPKMGRRPNAVPTVRVVGYVGPDAAAKIEAEQKRLGCSVGEAIDSLLSDTKSSGCSKPGAPFDAVKVSVSTKP